VCSEAANITIPEVTLRDPKAWKYIGKSQPRLDGVEKINGQAQYGIDFKAPGLLTAVLARGPGFHWKVKSFDASKAKQVVGVRDVVEVSAGIAVLADNYWSARQGRDALQIAWEPGDHPQLDTKDQIEEYKKLSKTKGVPTQQKGDATSAFSTAATTFEAEYWVPYLAHAPMEPLNCAVKISADACEIWTGTQLLTFDQAAAAKELGLQPGQVTIHTPFLGGSFGRRGSLLSDWVVEAVQIARASGKFIKLIWSREDDIKGGYYRPAYLHRARIALNADGLPIAWEHRIVGQGVFRNTPVMPDPEAIDYSSVEGVQDSPYLESIPDHVVELHTTEPNVPVLPWRSVGKSHTCFVMESLIDEIAVLNKKDPIAFRITLLKDHPRYLSILNLVAEKSGWASPLPAGRSRGVAVYDGNGSYVAYVVEASVADRKIRVHRVVCVIDCGLVVNPEGVRAQMESCVVFGLTAALYGEITLEKGQVKQQNFSDYRMLRIGETPLIEVHIVTSTEKMGGAGEPGVPPIAPALTNALFSATGKRVRKLPVRIEDLI
jgi:isoquinoline 1-oxidoreductase subunit beta